MGIRVEDGFGSQRSAAALEYLREGGRIDFGRCSIALRESGTAVAVIASRWQPGLLNEALAAEELGALEQALEELKEAWPAFKKQMGETRVRLQLSYDYGGGSVLLCERDGAGIRWDVSD
ncbi:MAG: hypothetical protein AAF436_02480 [Myxococcota bacterium]